MANRLKLKNPDRYRESERLAQARRRKKIRENLHDLKSSGCSECGEKHLYYIGKKETCICKILYNFLFH
jgi:hypothetical protein